MLLSTKNLCLALLLTMMLGCLLPTPSHAEDTMKDTLPASITSQVHTPLMPVGSGTYRKMGLSIYRATLWAPSGIYNANKPYALELRYNRSLSKDTMVDTVMDDIRDQQVADNTTLTKWEETLNKALPAVEDGDVIIGLAVPGKKSMLFFNGLETTSIEDPVFSTAFFNIWLGDGADESLRNKLLANAQ
jgi:hypothetical protein